MKKNLKMEFLLLLVILLVFACLSLPVSGENHDYQNGVNPQRNVLVEAFTGSWCRNCTVDILTVERYVRTHSNIFMLAYHFNDQMATEDIEVVIFRFTDAFPGFAVDRTVYKDLNSLVARMNNCAQKIEERLLIPPRMTIDLSYTYSPESRLIDLDVALHTLETIDANCYLHIVVAEDSLKYPQQGGADPFYHMHTVRDFITGTDGERLNDSVLAEGTDIHRNYAYTLQSKFKPEKIRIVVFVSEGIVGPVCQAEELVLVENIVTRVDELTPDTFRVHAPYPNPFNPVTTIEFTLPSESHVSLVMYDVLGRVVDIPVDRTLSTGTHRIVWDGRDRKGITLADGLYLFRLTAGNHIAHGKVTLLR